MVTSVIASMNIIFWEAEMKNALRFKAFSAMDPRYCYWEMKEK